MPPLIIYFVGFVAVVLYLLLPVWLAVPVVIVLVLVALFRFRHLGHLRQNRERLDRVDSTPGVPPASDADDEPADPVADHPVARPAGWETRDTADLKVCVTKEPPATS